MADEVQRKSAQLRHDLRDALQQGGSHLDGCIEDLPGVAAQPGYKGSDGADGGTHELRRALYDPCSGVRKYAAQALDETVQTAFFKCGGQFPDVSNAGLYDVLERLLDALVELNAKSLNGGFEDDDLSLQIVLHGVGHALCSAIRIRDGGGKGLVVFRCSVDDGQQAGHSLLPRDGTGHSGLLLLIETRKPFPQLAQHVGQRQHIALRIRERDTQLRHRRSNVIRWACKACKHGAERSAGLLAFDARIRHQADGLGAVLNAVAQRSGKRRRILECSAHHGNVGVRGAGCLCENIGKVSGIGRRQTESRERIRHNIGHGAEFFTAGRRKIHDAGQAVQHGLRIPAGHGHVFECFS